MENNITLLIEEAETIKWLLIALVCIGFLLLSVFCLVVWMLYVAGTAMLSQQGEKIFRVQAEDFLCKNEAAELLEHCNDRLNTHPNDIWAHWYLGQANFNISAWRESKRNFERVLEIDPSWFHTIETWLEKIEEKTSESGPKLVE